MVGHLTPSRNEAYHSLLSFVIDHVATQSIVNIRNIELVNNPAKYDDEYHFRIKFEAISALAEDLEWKLVYVGSANSEDYDQELDSCMVGPVPIGVNAFDFIAPAPAHHLLPSDHPDDVMGVTVIIIAASYRDKEFVRVGYYVNTYYEDEALIENPGDRVIWEKLHRNVLIEKPKVTRFTNAWDSGPQTNDNEGPIGDNQMTTSGNGGADMFFSAPVPAPIQKAAPPPQTSTEGGMEVDQPMGVA